MGMEVGGVNATVIRNPVTGEPYIPGSSLKGKIRSLLEQREGRYERLGSIEFGPDDKPEHTNVRFFGNVKGSGENIPSKVLFRDARMIGAGLLLQKVKTFDLPFTEVKTEVVIDRIKSSALPRSLERVPAGIEFRMSIVLNVWEELPHALPQEVLLKVLFDGFHLLEKDYLGGKGSRGSGQVKIGIENISKIEKGDLNDQIPPLLKYSPAYAAAVYGYPA
jgi:CRISPR-associated protein Csm3